MPGTLIGKLPLEFKKMGFDTHSQFTQLALDAEQLGDGAQTLEQLGTLLENCVACHAIYKFEIERSNQ
jgi:mono/diheme cytochrome c family protein